MSDLTALEHLALGFYQPNRDLPHGERADRLKHLDLSDNALTAGTFPTVSALTAPGMA